MKDKAAVFILLGQSNAVGVHYTPETNAWVASEILREYKAN